MCGRFAAEREAEDLAREFDIDVIDADAEALPPSWNVAPTDPVRVILDRRQDHGTTRELHVARWGLLPPWSSTSSSGRPLFNARVETAATKRSFAKPLQSQRCVVPAGGYFEWRVNSTTPPTKTPFYIADPSGVSLAFAGLYSWWRDPARADDDPARWVLSTTILTTTARDGLEAIHDREPIVLDRSALTSWLAADVTTDGALEILKAPGPELAWHEVSPRVGSVRNNDADLVRAV